MEFEKKSRDCRWRWRACLVASLLLGYAGLPHLANAQIDVMAGGARNQITGSVLIDGDSMPATRVRVDITALSGGQVLSTFTDAAGRFEAAAPTGGAYVVKVEEQGYEPVEERVDMGYEGTSGVLIMLRKQRAAASRMAAGYTVSVKDLRIPGKARNAFEKGLERMAKQDFSGGLGHFKEATDAFPDYYQAYYQAGLANVELRRPDDAEQAFQRSIDLSGGGFADAQFALAALLCDKQQYQEAERMLRHAIDVDANSWKGHLFLGQALFGLGRFAEAEKSVREALLRRPDIPSAYIVLANIHIRRHEYVLGVQDLDTYLNMRPDGSTAEQAKAVRAAAQRLLSRVAQMESAPLFVY